MEIISLGISLALIVVVVIISVRELYINYYNPIPRFENGDKCLDEICLVKTRKIIGHWECTYKDN